MCGGDLGRAQQSMQLPLQVKEMGVLGMDCECLARDAYKLFEVYWYLAETHAVPVHWNETFSADYNMNKPAHVKINGTAATAFWAVSVEECVGGGG